MIEHLGVAPLELPRCEEERPIDIVHQGVERLVLDHPRAEECRLLQILDAPLDLPRAKGAYRSDRRPYREVLSDAARTRIEQVCAREIAALGYAWQEPDAARGSRPRDTIHPASQPPPAIPTRNAESIVAKAKTLPPRI